MPKATIKIPQQPSYPIRTPRLWLRPVTVADVDAVNAYRSQEDVVRYLPHPPQSRDDTVLTVNAMAAQSALTEPGQWLDLAVEHGESRELIGEVLLKWNAENPELGEIGFAFTPSVHGKGIAFEACQAALKLAFADFGWHRVEGICDERNHQSAALMKRLGMRHEATFVESDWSKGEWTSLQHYAILAREWRERQES